jgi:hypothetical protein
MNTYIHTTETQSAPRNNAIVYIARFYTVYRSRRK